MKSTILITSILILYFSSSVSAQKATNLEEFAKDPKTAEMAAKADVYILGKKISNDTQAHSQNQLLIN